jgi:hypothetical protein
MVVPDTELFGLALDEWMREDAGVRAFVLENYAGREM